MLKKLKKSFLYIVAETAFIYQLKGCTVLQKKSLKNRTQQYVV